LYHLQEIEEHIEREKVALKRKLFPKEQKATILREIASPSRLYY